MDYSKQGNISETSSDEKEQASSQRIKDNNKSTGIGGRFYECTFCKRGFTNAQALGGHMNIHRKDKAKSKPNVGCTDQTSISRLATNSSLNRSDEFDQFSNSSMYSVPISNEHSHYQAHKGGTLMNYQFYLPMSVINCPPQYAYCLTDSIEHVASSRDSKIQEEVLETNLSLEISREKNTDEADEIRIEHQVDLELRLGHGP